MQLDLSVSGHGSHIVRRGSPLPNQTTPDRRVERTRQSLFEAFRDLFFERGFDRISVRDIVARAGVGRSTFYEHFESKDELLRRSVAPLFDVLAEAASSPDCPARLPFILGHFWEQRRLTRAMLGGSTRRLLSELLAELIERRLAVSTRTTRKTVPLRLVAAQLAEGQLGLIAAWVTGKAVCQPHRLAQALHAATRGAGAALLAAAAPG
jgi:AcrR family transcriptional regulator